MKCIINGIKTNYEIIGEGKPILCLHGYAVDHRLMKNCLEPTFINNDGYKRIYLDLPGMGYTEINDSIKTTDDFLEFVISFINNIIKEDNFLVAGESFGAYLTYGLLYKMKDRIDGIFLICPPANANEDRPNLPKRQYIIDEPIDADVNDPIYKEFRKMAVISNQEVYNRFLQDNATGMKLANMDVLYPYKKSGYDFSFEDSIKNITFDKPAVILLGKQDDIVGYTEMFPYLDTFSRCTMVIVDGAGHNLQIEQPEILNAHMQVFLNKIQ